MDTTIEHAQFNQTIVISTHARFPWQSPDCDTRLAGHTSRCATCFSIHPKKTEDEYILNYFAKKTLKVMRRKKAIKIHCWPDVISFTHCNNRLATQTDTSNENKHAVLSLLPNYIILYYQVSETLH